VTDETSIPSSLICLTFFFRCFFVVDGFCYSWRDISYFVRTEGSRLYSYSQGLNKVGFVGLFQLFRDAIKLFTKEQYFLLVSNYLIYYFSPIFGFFFPYWFDLCILRN
jgi:NADH:ubiquinone oxidoreductase subunit H